MKQVKIKMAMTPRDELADELTKRLHDPGAYVERGAGDRKDRMEPLKLHQVRAVMDYFEDVQKREAADGKMVIVARGPYRDKSPELDGE